MIYPFQHSQEVVTEILDLLLDKYQVQCGCCSFLVFTFDYAMIKFHQQKIIPRSFKQLIKKLSDLP